MGTNPIGKNIKQIREYYGETQLDLACAIDTVPTTISNYERGDRIPSPEILQKIAKHYKVEVTILLDEKKSLSERNLSSFISDISSMSKLERACFPISYSEEAMKDPHYRKGIDGYRRLNKNDDGNISVEEMVDPLCEYADSFYKAFCEDGVIEAAGGFLWCVLTLLVLINSAHIINPFMKMLQGHKKAAEIAKEALHTENNELLNRYDITAFKESITGNVIACIQALKKSQEWSELGDFYLAQSFVVHVFNNDESDEESATAGMHMHTALYLIENKYSRAFLDLLIE